jgi:hypothetical protein
LLDSEHREDWQRQTRTIQGWIPHILYFRVEEKKGYSRIG